MEKTNHEVEETNNINQVSEETNKINEAEEGNKNVVIETVVVVVDENKKQIENQNENQNESEKEKEKEKESITENENINTNEMIYVNEIVNKNLNENEAVNSNSNTTNSPETQSGVETQTGTGTQTEAEINCIVCEENKRNIRLPCGHALLCEPCTKKLLQLQLPCPTCRSPFNTFYKINTAQLDSQPSFLNPLTSIQEFGNLQKMSFRDASLKIFNRLHNGAKTCTQIILILSSLVLIFAFFMSPFAIGITQLIIGIQSIGEYCDKPLVPWSICSGIVHLISFIFIACLCVRQNTENYNPSILFRRISSFLKVSFFILYLIGGIYVYQVSNCNPLLLAVSWYIVTLAYCFIGSLIFPFLCICLWSFCSIFWSLTHPRPT